MGTKVKTILEKIHNRLKAECIWEKNGIYTQFVYNCRKPLMVFKPTHLGGASIGFCDVAVVAFNNSGVVEYQIRSLKKFFEYPFRYTVYDNSTKENISQEILAICKKYDVGYVKLPKQEFLPKGWGSYSHGIACNYLFNKFVKNGGAKYFMLLDHDLFLVDKFDISKQFDSQFFYGTKHGFYIWPGLWAMPMERLLKYGVDFRPSLHLRGDTGARNYDRHFKGLDWDRYHIVKDVHCFLDDTDNDIFRNGYSLMDDRWLHCWNASDYMGKGVDNKMRRIYQMLEDKLK